ncbi:MAG: alpha/beta fold hydrolase [Proteobacteria bacterium]|nr:alpha/beta fold hydrolase [Pseudomonadota bacterium]
MIAVQLTPEKVFKEVTEFNSKLAEGIKILRDVGELPAGVTPKEAVYREDKMTLYHYQNPTEKKPTNQVPLLVSYALVNRPYMTDLQENRSLIRGLLDSGQDVYLIDWGYPDRSDRFLTLDDYINGYIDRCVDVLCERHDVESVNLLGICQGGAFSLCYTYRQFINDFYKYNKLIAGGVELGGRKVSLKDVTMPVLNVYALSDHLVPPSASKPLKKYVGTTDYTALSFKGGHIGIYVSGTAQREVPPSIGKWLNERG